MSNNKILAFAKENLSKQEFTFQTTECFIAMCQVIMDECGDNSRVLELDDIKITVERKQ